MLLMIFRLHIYIYKKIKKGKFLNFIQPVMVSLCMLWSMLWNLAKLKLPKYKDLLSSEPAEELVFVIH
jgi:hypothetical protein